MKDMLIVYFSASCGNTERVAIELEEATGADMARIRTAEPYPSDHQALVDQGKDEVEAGLMPDLEPLNFAPEDYDVVAIGTPTWWYTMAPAVRSFIAAHAWAGKTVVPFMTNGGWPGTVIRDIEAACAGATIACPMCVRFDSSGGSHLITPKREIQAWARRVRDLLEG